MRFPRLHAHRDLFPGIPIKALEFFHPRNAVKDGNAVRARTVYDFAMHLAIPTGDTTKSFPRFHRLNLILQRMTDLNMLMVVHRGGIDSMDAAYFCALTDAEITSIRDGIDYAVYGFPIIYEELSPAVVPIVHINANGLSSIGTSFLRTQHLLLTAKHCLAGAKSLSIRGIGKEQFASAQILVHNNDVLDLAAIHFPDPVLPSVKPIAIGIGRVLDEVLVLGYPNVPGFTELLAAEKAAISSRLTVTKGAIASEATELFSKASLFLITARVRGGFSGGPVLNDTGAAVGLVSRQPISDASHSSEFFAQYDNLGYGVAIPSEVISDFLTACKDGDHDIAAPLDIRTIDYVPI